MSLLIWLPLQENLTNQGLLNVEVSTLGTITYEDGKLGKCAKIGTEAQSMNGISINSNLVEALGDEYSASVWIKPTGKHVHYEGAIISSGNWNGQCWAFGVGENNNTIDPFGPRYNFKINCNIPVNEWTHLVSTTKNNVATVYKNGELVGTYDFGNRVMESDATNTTIGRETYGNGYFSFNGSICDVRIYNHCLSPSEAKELSKGLALHYPLSRGGLGQDNILKNTDIPLVTQQNGTYTECSKYGNYYFDMNPKEFLLRACDEGLTLSYDVHCPGVYQDSSQSLKRIGCYLSMSIKDNTTGTSTSFYGHHTLSGVATSRHTLDKTNSLNTISSTATENNPDTSFNGHYSRTIYPKQNQAVLNFYNNPDNYTIICDRVIAEIRGAYIKDESWIRNVHLEFGDKETAWTPHPLDDLYTCLNIYQGNPNIFLKSQKVFDSQGSRLSSTTTHNGLITDDSAPGKQYRRWNIVAENNYTRGVYYTYANTVSGLNVLTENEIYTVSFYAKCSKQKDMSVTSVAESQTILSYDGNTYTSGSPGLIIGTSWARHSVTFKFTATNKITTCFYLLYLDENVTLDIALPKLEVGSKATPWCPAVTDADYDPAIYSNGTEYDVSGYQHNGTISGPLYEPNSPLHYMSAKFDGDDDFIAIEDSSFLYPILTGGSTPFTMSFWVYHADTTRGIIFADYGFPGGVGFNVELKTNHGIRFYWNGDPDMNFSTATNAVVGLNQWSLVTIVYTGTQIKHYNNGVLITTYDRVLPELTKTSGQYYLGRDKRTGTTALNGYLSDFRIYATALSAEDVADLYKGGIM